MANIDDIRWASEGGLTSEVFERLKDSGYTTMDGTLATVPEYPLLQVENGWKNKVYENSKELKEDAKELKERVDNLSAEDVNYEFAIESESNVISNTPFNTFTTRYGTASSNAGTTSLATQVTASDYSGTFTRSTQYAQSGDFRRILETNDMLFFQGARIDGDTTPKYMYGLNDVGGINYYSAAELSNWGIPIHRYDEILGDYVLDYRLSSKDIYANFSASFGAANTPYLNVMQHNNILYVVFGRVAPDADTDKAIFQLVKYDMENRVVLFTKSLVSVLATPTGVLSAENLGREGDHFSGYMDISPDGTKMAIVAPIDSRNETLPQKNGFLKAFHLAFAAFIVDISDPNLNYSDISDVKDWSSSGTLRDCYRRPEAFDVLKWEDDNTLHLISQFNKITDIEGLSNYSAGYPYLQHQKIDVNGLTATNNTTTDLTTLVIDSSSTLTSTNRTSKAFGADFNMDIGEFCIRTAGGGERGDSNSNPYVLNRFDLNSLTILATNENFPPSLFGASTIYGALPNMRNFYYDKNGKIIFTAGFFNEQTTVGVRMVYLDQQFISGTSPSTVNASDLPVTVAADDSSGNAGNLNTLTQWSSLIVYPTHTRFLSLMFLNDYNYVTDTKRSGGDYLNATSNIQTFDDLSIASVFENVPLNNSILPYMKRLKYNASTGSLTNVKSFVLAFDTTQATGGSQTISIVARGVTYNITGTGADWPTLLSDLADKLFAQGNFVNNAVVIANKAIYVTLSYPKNDSTVMTVEQNVSLTSGNCTIGSFEINSMDSSLLKDTKGAYCYLVDYTSLSTAMSTSFTDTTFKQYDTYVVGATNVHQAIDFLKKTVQDLQLRLDSE